MMADQIIKLREVDGCLNEHDVIKTKHFPQFDADVNAMGTIVTRRMAKVYVNDRTMYADTITGTLYNPKTGRCNSTKIWIHKVYK